MLKKENKKGSKPEEIKRGGREEKQQGMRRGCIDAISGVQLVITRVAGRDIVIRSSP